MSTPPHPKVLLFQRAYPDLVQRTLDPALLACTLHSKSFIDNQTRKDAQVPTISVYERATKLLSAVGDQIKTDSNKFHILLNILNNKESFSSLARILGTVTGECCFVCSQYNPPERSLNNYTQLKLCMVNFTRNLKEYATTLQVQ